MNECNTKLLASTDSASAAKSSHAADQHVEQQNSEQFGSFVALRRLEKVSVEAVRMQGCCAPAAGTAC